MKLDSREFLVQTPAGKFTVYLRPGWRRSYVSMCKDVWPALGGTMRAITVRNTDAVEIWLSYVGALVHSLDGGLSQLSWPFPEPFPV